MQTYSAFEYLCIDIANQYGLDKALFPDRITWVLDNINRLEYLDTPKKERPLYLKAVQTLRKTQYSEPTGHLVGLDACCSGMQIMSVLSGCVEGCKATNLINTGERRDAYTEVTKAAAIELGEAIHVTRADIKEAQMTHLYGSKKIPKELFGPDSDELAAFYEANWVVCPGANEVLQDLLGSWQPYALTHGWKLPDNGHARVKVMEKVECRIEVDELDHATFSYEYYINCGVKKDVKNAANVIHSIDAYILRSMHRRCNYDAEALNNFGRLTITERQRRNLGGQANEVEAVTLPHHVYMERYEATQMVDSVIFDYLNKDTIKDLSNRHMTALWNLYLRMSEYQPFELVTVHDEFKCHPKNCNYMRQTYIDLFAELAESRVLEDIFLQLTGHECYYENKLEGLGDLIRQSEYALS
jgi:hypothetical protein